VLVVCPYRGGGAGPFPFAIKAHIAIVSGVAEWCKTMYP
jgi:hypothetical protein